MEPKPLVGCTIFYKISAIFFSIFLNCKTANSLPKIYRLFACHKISRNMLNYLYRYFLRFYIKYQFYIHIILYILYLRRVTTKIAKVHLKNLENQFNSTKVCRQACVFSIVCLTLSQIWTRKNK